MTINHIIDLAKNDQLTGHCLIKPALWCTRQIQSITDPYSNLANLAKRVCLAVVALIIYPIAAISGFVGLALKLIVPVKPAASISNRNPVLKQAAPIQTPSKDEQKKPVVAVPIHNPVLKQAAPIQTPSKDEQKKPVVAVPIHNPVLKQPAPTQIPSKDEPKKPVIAVPIHNPVLKQPAPNQTPSKDEPKKPVIAVPIHNPVLKTLPENDMSWDLKGLHDKMDALLRNLNDIRSEAGRQFQTAVQEFEGKYGATPSKDFEDLKFTFQKLCDLREGLFFTEVRIDDKNVMRVPPDGNCFFHAIGRGLVLLREPLLQAGITLINEPLDHASLRERVVQWMREHMNDEMLRGYINEAIEAYSGARREQFQNERLSLAYVEQDVSLALACLEKAENELDQLQHSPDRYNLYLEKIERAGFFASGAEQYAVSQMYHVKIAIRRQIGGRFIDGFDATMGENYPHSLTLVHVNGDHFDLQVST